MGQDSMTSRYKPSYTQGIAAIPSPILSGSHLRDAWLGCEGSRVRDADKTSWFLLTLLSSFIHPSLPSHIRAPSALRLIYTMYYNSGHVCYLFHWFNQKNKPLFRCAMTKLKAIEKPFHFLRSGPTLQWSFSRLPQRHHRVCYSTGSINLCTIHTMIYELDKQTKNIDVWVETRKIESKTPSRK